MAANIITQFVLKQFAKRSARKTGITQLLKASDSVVQSNVRNIEIILKDMGINTKNLKSTDDVLKVMNYRNAMMNQHIKQQFGGLGLGEGIKSLGKKKTPIVKDPTKETINWDRDPFRGFTPKIVPKDKTLLKDSPEAIAKIKAENKAAAERLRKKKLDEEPDDLASGGRVPLMYGGDPGFAFEYGGSWADWHDQHRDTMPVEQYIQTKLPKDRLPFRQMQTGGLAYMLGEPTYMKYGVGGSVGHAPWLKPTGQQKVQGQEETPTPNVATRPDPMKAPRGIPSLAPKNMDPAYMQQQAMQKAMMGQGQRPMAAEGGLMRMGFKKGGDWSRRKFLQFIGGAAALPIVGKYFKAAKVAKPAAAVTETIIKSNASGMPAWFPSLVKRVMDEGTDVTKKFGTVEREIVHATELPSGTKVLVTQDLGSGDTMVDIGLGKHGWSSGRHGQPTRLALRKGEWIEPTKGKKGIKTKDEFMVEEAEFTGGHPENIKFEETVDFRYGEHGSDFSEVEKYAIGKNKDKKIIGKQADKDAWAEGRAESAAEDFDPEFSKGGLAYLLGE